MKRRTFTDTEVSDRMARERRWVSTRTALVCMDCDTAFETGGNCECPRCGSRESWRLALALERRSA